MFDNVISLLEIEYCNAHLNGYILRNSLATHLAIAVVSRCFTEGHMTTAQTQLVQTLETDNSTNV